MPIRPSFSFGNRGTRPVKGQYAHIMNWSFSFPPPPPHPPEWVRLCSAYTLTFLKGINVWHEPLNTLNAMKTTAGGVDMRSRLFLLQRRCSFHLNMLRAFVVYFSLVQLVPDKYAKWLTGGKKTSIFPTLQMQCINESPTGSSKSLVAEMIWLCCWFVLN